MSNRPHHRPKAKADAPTGDDVVSWIDRFGIAILTPEQEAMVRRMYADGDPQVVLGTDGTGDDAVTIAAVAKDGQIWLADVGTPPPVDPYAWKAVGWASDPVDFKPAWSDPDHDPGPDLQTWLKDASKVDTRSITVKFDADIAALARITAVPPMVMPFRGFDDNITGRAWADGLHPGNTLEWLQVVEGRDADGNPLLVCDHCGEPTPCTEKVLRHMDTDMHHAYCRPTGFCVIAERRVSELPGR